MHDGELEGRALIRTVTVPDPSGRTLDLHSLGRSPLGDRYAAMFTSYATEDALMFSAEVEDALHGHLHTVTEEFGHT